MRIARTGIAAGLLVAGLSGCGAEVTIGSAPTSSAAAPTTVAPTTTAKVETTTTVASTPGAVDIKDYTFTPATQTVKVGDTVTWTNHDDNPHYVKSDSPDATLDSGTMDPGGAPYVVTFTKAGTYAYHCNIHNTMKGTIVVS